MRTAEEILKYDLDVKEWLPISFELAVIAINKARKEAIEECASWVVDILDRQKVLSLIKELK